VPVSVRNILPIALVGPLVLFFLLAAVIPHQRESAGGGGAEIQAGGYLILVIARVLLIGAVLVAFGKLYLREFPFQIDRWGWLVGAFGGVLWIAVCGLQVEPWLLAKLGFSETAWGARAGVNPFAVYPSDADRWTFFVFRFALLVLIVPIAEELFLRGFLIRVIDSDNWSEQSFSQIGKAGLIAGTVYGVLTHPSEFVAAALWFSLISGLMVRTGRFWNCVLAHAITNLMLGIYVCYTHNWQLW
jgi:CAAX prenyl protease-like protein